MTKSLILSEVMEKCKDIKRDFKQVEEGRLVRIDNVSLSKVGAAHAFDLKISKENWLIRFVVFKKILI